MRPDDLQSELATLAAHLPKDPGFEALLEARRALAELAERGRALGPSGRDVRASVAAAIADVDASLDARAASVALAIRNGALRGPRLAEDLARLTAHPLDTHDPHFGDEAADALIERVLGTNGRYDGGASPGAEMIHYDPSPVSATLALAKLGWFAQGAVFVDVGSGTGRVPILASLLGEGRAVGIEIDEALAIVAREAAARLGVDLEVRVGDARLAPIDDGTEFFFFTPFVGGVLDAMLARLAALARDKPIRIGSWGPATEAIARHPAFAPDRDGFGPFDLVTFRPR